MPDKNRAALEHFAKACLIQFAKVILWEPKESLRSFVEILMRCVADKLERELPEAIRKNRVEDLKKRAYRWLEKSFWEDIRNFPDDALDKRTLRLKNLVYAAPSIPPRRGDGEYFPVSVFIEYDYLEKLLQPVFKKRPPKPTRLTGYEARVFAIGTRDGERGLGLRRAAALQDLERKRYEHWKKEILELANRIIPVGLWPKGQEVWFAEEEIIKLTPRTAALRLLGAKLKLGEEAVSKLVKTGKQILPPKILEKMEKAYEAHHSDDSWQFLIELNRKT